MDNSSSVKGPQSEVGNIWMNLTICTSEQSFAENTPQTKDSSSSFLFVAEDTVKLVHEVSTCYVVPAVSALGILGNAFSLLVLATRIRRYPTNVALMFLAVSDTAYLIMGNIQLVGCFLKLQDPVAAINFSVTSYVHALWLSVVFSRVTNVITALIAGERFVVVWLPLQARAIVTRSSIYVTMVSAYVITGLAHFPLFLRNEVTWVTREIDSTAEQKVNITVAVLRETQFSMEHKAWLDFYKDFLLTVAFRLTPVVIVAICTTLTLIQILRQRRWRLQVSTFNITNSMTLSATARSTQESRLTTTLLWLCFMFFVCSLPGLVIFSVRYVEPQFDYYGRFSGMFSLVSNFHNFLLALNSSGNFIIYVGTVESFMPICVHKFRKKMQQGRSVQSEQVSCPT